MLYKIPRPAACGFLLSEPPQRGRESPGGGGCVGGERRTRRDRERERESWERGGWGEGGRGAGGVRLLFLQWRRRCSHTEEA